VTYLRVLEVLLPVVCTLGAVALLARPEDSPPGPPQQAPRPAYLGSTGCEMCHPSEHASWQRTFHRTMTRRPSELAWDGKESPVLPALLADGALVFRLRREGSRIMADGPNLHLLAQLLYRTSAQAASEGYERPTEAAVERAFEQVPEVERPVVLVTGSHHYLAFWLAEADDRELLQLPFVYHLQERKWAPRRQAFLEPPDAPLHIATWNSNCIQCHAVAGEPQETEWRDETGTLHVRYRSRVAELGIACEACHGPGRAHAEHYRTPLRRGAARASGQLVPPAAQTLLSPASMDAVSSSAICGQCHAYFVPKNEAAFWTTGYARAVPSEPVERNRQLLTPTSPPGTGVLLNRELDSIFWPDGTIRVGGREYNGLLASACYSRGQGERQLGCGSCHSMHDSDPDDQLAQEVAADPDSPCRNCHGSVGEHSGHAKGSLGASCVNCHMPKTTYALQKSIRSHRIQIPDPQGRDVPSACSLCHVDQALGFFVPAAAAPSSDPIGMGVRAALAGNAAERAIYAAALASTETQQTIGLPLARTLLQALAHDPYHAVRRIAERGLAALPPGSGDGGPSPLAPELLERLVSARDNRDIVISE
jgi:hypothetical protein